MLLACYNIVRVLIKLMQHAITSSIIVVTSSYTNRLSKTSNATTGKITIDQVITNNLKERNLISFKFLNYLKYKLILSQYINTYKLFSFRVPSNRFEPSIHRYSVALSFSLFRGCIPSSSHANKIYKSIPY